MPVPFRQLVLKVHSRCDLACTYCYVYEHADQSWSSRPRVISGETVTRVAARLAEHARTHALPSVHVVLHGGEPLLAGPAVLRQVCAELRTALDGVGVLDLRIHTNGVQLSERYLDLFAEFDVKVGISLDGDQVANDRHRLYPNGRSSHRRVLDAVALLRRDRYRHLYAGLLCTVHPANDPVAVYDALAALEPPRIDFLLPHATWDNPPLRATGRPTEFADWLTTVLHRWDDRGRPFSVRLFDSVISTLRGGPSLTESLGLDPADLVVVETDGTIEQADSLKTAYDGAPATGFDVFRHSLDTAAGHPGVLARQQGLAGLAAACRSCPVVHSCGGGMYAHRYRTGNGFDNPSVYCADLKALVERVADRIGPLPATGTGRPAAGPEPSVPYGFDELAAGTGDGTAVTELAAAQRRVARGWLAVVQEAVGGRGGELWDRTWQLLARLEERPGALDPLLAHPYLRAWAAGCLDALPGGVPRGGLPGAGYLTSLAVPAALRAGFPGPLPAPAGPDGTVFLPGLGRARFAAPAGRLAEVTADGTGFAVRLGAAEIRVGARPTPDPRWEPLRRLALPGDVPGGPERVLDDLDPHRDCFPRPALPRLTDTGAERAGRALAAAWRLLRAAAPGHAAELAASLTSVTPLAVPPPAVPDTGALAGGRRGIGALGLSPDGDPAAVARAALTGWQYAKLDALLEQCDLYDETDPRPLPVPWGGGPLPAAGLFALAYARSATVALADRPERHAEETARALDTLRAAGVLTPLGERFAAGLRSARLPAARHPTGEPT